MKRVFKLIVNLKLDKFAKNILERFNFNLHIKLNGKRFVIPIIKNIGYDNLLLNDELWMMDILKKILSIKSGTFIDIGVNIGQTLLELKSVDDSVKYIGFEPNPACIFYCNNLIRKNNFKNSLMIPIGIYDESKVISFNIFGEAGSGSTLVENLRPGYNHSEKIFVPVFIFDELYKYIDFNLVSTIKIDVEGGELKVLKGMKNILKTRKPFVICEILWAHNETKLQENKYRNEEILKLLNEIQFSLFQVIKTEDNNKIKTLRKIINIENQVYTLGNKELCDYFMVHHEVGSLIQKQFEE